MRIPVAVLAAVVLALSATPSPAEAATSAASCTAWDSGAAPGGFVVTLRCSDHGFVHGYGSTLTDASVEARLDNAVACDGWAAGRTTGGYDVTLRCVNRGFIHGLGGTLTGAAQVARLSAGT